ncbi:MAG: 5-(carboxyamino)imidazole ribonucleotide mutase [Saprospiraceae bacterium]
MTKPQISIIMGSDSDLPIMRQAADFLTEMEIAFELTIVSAHRTPDRLVEFSKKAHGRGIKVVIAGAGGAAHLPGMVASLSPLPIIGVPIKSSNSIDGWDSVLSILQMPSGVPVATVALNGAKNAGILAAQILGSNDKVIQRKITAYKKKLAKEVAKKYTKLEKIGYQDYKKD